MGLWLASLAGGLPAETRARERPDFRLRRGDVVFQVSRSAQSEAIRTLTDSPYTHVGIVHFENGEPRVFEAAGRVRSTPFDRWVARGRARHFVVKRLVDRDRRLSKTALAAMRRVAEGFRGKRYDFRFAWSDDRLYCSELVYKIYARGAGIRLSRKKRFGDYDLDGPVARRLARSRYEGPLPLSEPVVSPAALFASKELVTVHVGRGISDDPLQEGSGEGKDRTEGG
jgi:hypothetical protein